MNNRDRYISTGGANYDVMLALEKLDIALDYINKAISEHELQYPSEAYKRTIMAKYMDMTTNEFSRLAAEIK